MREYFFSLLNNICYMQIVYEVLQNNGSCFATVETEER